MTLMMLLASSSSGFRASLSHRTIHAAAWGESSSKLATLHLLHDGLPEVVVVEDCAHDVVQPLPVCLEQSIELHVRELLVDQDHVHVDILGGEAPGGTHLPGWMVEIR